MYRAIRIFLITAVVTLMPVTRAFADYRILVDHTCTDLNLIPESAAIQAKADLHIAYGHTSHGSQLVDGMGASGTELDTFLTNSPAYPVTPGLYVWNNGGSNNALDLHDYAMGGDVGYYPQWVNNTLDYLGTPDGNTGRGTEHPDVNVIIWSWCGQVSGRTQQSMIDTYLSPMDDLEAAYPGITFVYMTGHLDGTGADGNLNLRNQQIRDFCRDNQKVLYDFADIESFDPDGLVNYMVLDALDSCYYDADGNGSRESNWAISWQNSHVSGVDWWPSGAAHSQHLNGNRKGYAAWWLWARIAGWNPGGCPDCSGSSVAIRDTTYTTGTDCECAAASSITLGPNVTVKSGARVRVSAPVVSFLQGVTIEPGADFKAGGQN